MSTISTSNRNINKGKVSGSHIEYDFTPAKNLSFPVLVVGLILLTLVVLFIINVWSSIQ